MPMVTVLSSARAPLAASATASAAPNIQSLGINLLLPLGFVLADFRFVVRGDASLSADEAKGRPWTYVPSALAAAIGRCCRIRTLLFGFATADVELRERALPT